MIGILIVTLLLNFPTTILTLYVALGMQGCFLNIKRLLAFGLFSGILIAIYRSLPLPFGAHIPLFAVTLVILVRHLSQGSWGMAILTGLGAHLVTAVGEGLITAPVFMMLHIPMDKALENPWLIVAAGWLSNVLLLPIVAIIYFRRNSKGVIRG